MHGYAALLCPGLVLLIGVLDAGAVGATEIATDAVHYPARRKTQLYSGKARVNSGVTQLSKVAEHLHMVAGTGGAEVLQGDLKRIDRALRLIRAQYPGGSLPFGVQSAGRHARGHRD